MKLRRIFDLLALSALILAIALYWLKIQDYKTWEVILLINASSLLTLGNRFSHSGKWSKKARKIE